MRTTLQIGAAALAVVMGAGLARGHEGDFFIGHDGGAGSLTGQLAVEFDADEPYALPIVTLFPGDGFGLDDPGFANLDMDEPDENFYMLAGNPQLVLELVSFSPGLVMYNDPPLAIALQNPGDTYALPAGPAFDDHGFWFVESPDFSAEGSVYDFSFQVRDLSGQYAASPVYTAQFVAAPEPASLVLLATGAFVLRRRGR